MIKIKVCSVWGYIQVRCIISYIFYFLELLMIACFPSMCSHMIVGTELATIQGYLALQSGGPAHSPCQLPRHHPLKLQFCWRSPLITKPTRLISIESQPKKIVGVVVVVIGFVIVGVHVVVVFIPVVDPRNIPLKFGSNQVINR